MVAGKGGRPVELWLANAISLVYLVVVWFGLIDGVRLWIARRRGVPIGWIAMVFLPLALSLEAIRPLFFAAGCVAALAYHLLRRFLKYQDDPDTLLLFFCSYGSVAASGAIAGLTIALFSSRPICWTAGPCGGRFRSFTWYGYRSSGAPFWGSCGK